MQSTKYLLLLLLAAVLSFGLAAAAFEASFFDNYMICAHAKDEASCAKCCTEQDHVFVKWNQRHGCACGPKKMRIEGANGEMVEVDRNGNRIN
jgi:hypothetical protein